MVPHLPGLSGSPGGVRSSRLDLAFLINGQHHSVHRRIHIEANDVLDRLGESRAVGALEGA
jgi:hypothetical protein